MAADFIVGSDKIPLYANQRTTWGTLVPTTLCIYVHHNAL
jgi:hypothetical protein